MSTRNYLNGRVAERLKALVLKTSVPLLNGTVGSNPTPTAVCSQGLDSNQVCSQDDSG